MASYQEQKKYKQLDKEFEELDALGQEDEKEAIKDTKKIMSVREKARQEEKDKLTELIMGASSGSKQHYIFFLSELMQRRMQKVEFGKGWSYEVIPTDRGVVLEMTYFKKYFRLAFEPCGDALYDLNAINTFGIRAENTVDRIAEEEKTLQLEKIKTDGRSKQRSAYPKDH